MRGSGYDSAECFASETFPLIELFIKMPELQAGHGSAKSTDV
jgi:hypothetical protein